RICYQGGSMIERVVERPPQMSGLKILNKLAFAATDTSWFYSVLAVMTLMALAIRLIGIERSTLWYDEVMTAECRGHARCGFDPNAAGRTSLTCLLPPATCLQRSEGLNFFGAAACCFVRSCDGRHWRFCRARPKRSARWVDGGSSICLHADSCGLRTRGAAVQLYDLWSGYRALGSGASDAPPTVRCCRRPQGADRRFTARP